MLDDPKVPGARILSGQDVVGFRVVGVAVHEVLESGLVPLDVHAGLIEGPDEDGVAAGDDDGFGDVDCEGVDVGEEGVLGHSLFPVRRQVCGLETTAWCGVCRAGWSGGIDRVVGPDRAGVVEDVAQAAGGDVGAEPVVAFGLVGVDDDVVALADGEEDGFSGVGDDGDEVGGDDLEFVAVEGDTNRGVDRDIDLNGESVP